MELGLVLLGLRCQSGQQVARVLRGGDRLVVVVEAVAPVLSEDLLSIIQSGASYLSQDFVMFFHVSCDLLPWQ